MEEEGGYDNNGFDGEGGREDEDYEFPEDRYTLHEEQYKDEDLRNELFKRNKHGVSVGKEKYKDSFVVKYKGMEYDLGEKARVASARAFRERYPNMNLSVARDGKIMFGFNQDGIPVVTVFSEGRNYPYDINSSEFPQEIKNILEPGEEGETETTGLLQSPEKTTGRNVWEEEDGVKINISEDASSEVSVFWKEFMRE